MFLSLAAWRSHIPLFPSKCKLSGGGSPQPASLALVLKANLLDSQKARNNHSL